MMLFCQSKGVGVVLRESIVLPSSECFMCSYGKLPVCTVYIIKLVIKRKLLLHFV